jgi:ESS family glutamate:Na+ symporter
MPLNGGRSPSTPRCRRPLQNTFFASVGFGASVLLLKRGGPLVLLMMVVATLVAALQNVLGAAVAYLLGEHPLMGVLAGSVTLTGGPATGLAFAPLFEEAGVPGASTLAVSAAMVGIVAGGLMGGPIGTYLLDRHPRRVPASPKRGTLENLAEQQFPEPATAVPAGEDVEAYALLKHLVVIITAVGAGVWVSAGFQALGWTLPAYIGAMIVAAVIRNLDDATGLIGMSQRTIDDLGTVALALFLVMALMTLRLWELAGVVIPLLVILFCQVVFIAAVCLLAIPRLMGRDYDAVVMATGFCGFMLGTTANAVANMGALVERYGPAPKAYLVVPLVGAFGIDFINGTAHHRLPQHLAVTVDVGATHASSYSFGSFVVLIVPLACSNLYWFRSMRGSVGTFSSTVITSPGCSGFL